MLEGAGRKVGVQRRLQVQTKIFIEHPPPALNVVAQKLGFPIPLFEALRQTGISTGIFVNSELRGLVSSEVNLTD